LEQQADHKRRFRFMPEGTGGAETKEAKPELWPALLSSSLPAALAIVSGSTFIIGYALEASYLASFGLEGFSYSPFEVLLFKGALFLPISLVASLALAIALTYASGFLAWKVRRKPGVTLQEKIKENAVVTLSYAFAFSVVLLCVLLGHAMGKVEASDVRDELEEGCASCFIYDAAGEEIVGRVVSSTDGLVALVDASGAIRILEWEQIEGVRRAKRQTQVDAISTSRVASD
jgi:hypothetical protein